MAKHSTLILGLAFALAANGTAGLAAASAAHTSGPPVCGTPAFSGTVTNPPDVDMWTSPVDASGEHELILAVHRDGHRFCYVYRFDGVAETVAPTIRVRRGERFALRIVNDIDGPSKGELVPSTAMLPCAPMPMPKAPVVHYVGYLNHVIDDRWMPKVAVDTNIHLHGFEGPAAEENIFLSTLSTPLHACEYHITIPRTQPPGTYIYHPHIHGASAIEVSDGLAGAWIVEPDAPQIAPTAEHVLVLRYRRPAVRDNPFAPQPDGNL
ncbi:MAG: multicopper oxidase domain-containing protein [Vulcanimicrobiaceae bacterium]